MEIYLQGLTMGLAYVAPIGLQNLFVINTALTQRKSRVYATALIVIFFDVTLGLACFFGIGAINPQALIDGSMMLGAFKATLPAGTDFFFVGGFASASVLWFLGISTIISLFSTKFTDKTLRVINVICGCVIIFYGLKLAWSFIQLVMPYFGA